MSNIFGNLVLTIVLLGLLAAVVFVMNFAAAPEQKILGVEGVEDPDYARYVEQIDTESIEASLREIGQFGSRYTASPGEARTREHIQRRLQAAGFEVMLQPVRVTVPVVKEATLLDADGQPIEDISVHPLPANWFRTPTTPPDGITGEVLRGERGLAREFEGENVQNSLIMLPLGRPWDTVAQMGAAAVLYFEEEEKYVQSQWEHHLRASFNIPRVLVRGDTDALEGRKVTLKVRVDHEPKWTFNVIGMLRPDIESNDLAILQTYYDAYSYTSDLAPGASQTVGPATLLTIADQLAASKQDLRRPMMVLFTAAHGQGIAGARRFAHVVGRRTQRGEALRAVEQRLEALSQRAQRLQAAMQVAQDEAYWSVKGQAEENDYWRNRNDSVRETFKAEIKRVFDRMLLDATEALEQSRLKWIRAGSPVTKTEAGEEDHPLFNSYQSLQQNQRVVRGLGSTPLGELKELPDQRSLAMETYNLLERLENRFSEQIDHNQQLKRQAEAEIKLARTLAPYERLMMLTLDLSLGGDRLGLAPGDGNESQACQPADSEMMSQFRLAATELNKVDPQRDYERNATGQTRLQNLIRGARINAFPYIASTQVGRWYYGSAPMLAAGHTALAIGNHADRRFLGSPHDTFDRAFDDPETKSQTLDNLLINTRLLAAMAEQIGRGHARVVPIDFRPNMVSISGQAVSKIGDSLVADHPMGGAVVRFDAKPKNSLFGSMPPGVGHALRETADGDGYFDLVGVSPNFFGSMWSRAMYLDGAVIDQTTGQVRWTLNQPDAAADGQYSVVGVPVEQLAMGKATLVLFRGEPMEVFPMPDPNTLRPYAGVDFLNPATAALPQEYKIESAGGGGMMVCYTPLGERLIFTFKKGATDNPNLLVVRAFALNAPKPETDDSPRQMPFFDAADGYAPDLMSRLINVEFDAAWSMAVVNNHRVQRQTRNGLADRMQQEFTAKGVNLAEEAIQLADQGRVVDGKLKALESLAYSQLAYPQTRKNTADAILGIVVFLFLAIPFVIFLEKLLIGSPDIRVQLTWVGLFFLLFFVALRFTHPAYELVRSPLIILLGFVSLALALMVGVFVAGKFSKNVGEFYRRSQQQVVAADVSRAGAAATAFNLGLNNLRRRPMRTGLTVATLVLITFVMICFTSVRSNVVQVDVEMGAAPYEGLLIREPDFSDVKQAVAPLDELYGRQHLVAPRAWGGNFIAAANEVPELAEFDIIRTRDDGGAFEATVNGVLGIDVKERQITGIDKTFTVMHRWFEDNADEVCFIPQRVFAELGLTEEQVRAGEAEVEISNREYIVAGVFDEEQMNALFGLDGQTLMPMNIISMADELQRLARGGEEQADLESMDVDRLPAESVVITPREAMPTSARVASVAVAFTGVEEYSERRELIDSYLERSGQKAYYGLEDRAYFGGRLRRGSLRGLIDLILPIIIAALTVLNTMHGSVYERRSELYVFNAVGLSPRHILWLFLAEALVYAVVGVVGGYLVAQGVGALINNLDLLAGLTMNYSSLSGIVVALVIILVVIVSAMFPARMASRLAAPAESMTRHRESSEQGVMELELPFTFNKRDRVAIIPYFMTWFEGYGEGSAGDFFCSPPEAGIRVSDDGNAEPYVRTQAWLKPYDLGVSQTVDLAVHRDPETGDNVARVLMQRESGDVDSWERCVHRFIGHLRKRLLTWRGVTDEDRARLLEQGRDLLDPQRSEA